MKETWVNVTEDFAKEFKKSYPNKLEHNFFMDAHSWHDFSDGKKLEDSFVMMADIDYNSGSLSYRIKKKYLEAR